MLVWLIVEASLAFATIVWFLLGKLISFISFPIVLFLFVVLLLFVDVLIDLIDDHGQKDLIP